MTPSYEPSVNPSISSSVAASIEPSFPTVYPSPTSDSTVGKVGVSLIANQVITNVSVAQFLQGEIAFTQTVIWACNSTGPIEVVITNVTEIHSTRRLLNGVSSVLAQYSITFYVPAENSTSISYAVYSTLSNNLLNSIASGKFASQLSVSCSLCGMADVAPSFSELFLTATISTSKEPSSEPSLMPFVELSTSSSVNPSVEPVVHSLAQLSVSPSMSPLMPSSATSSSVPSMSPSVSPLFYSSFNPSVGPSSAPSTTSRKSSKSPSVGPSLTPHVESSTSPSTSPSISSSLVPTFGPTVAQSPSPSSAPSIATSFDPSVYPSIAPTFQIRTESVSSASDNGKQLSLILGLAFGFFGLLIIVSFVCLCKGKIFSRRHSIKLKYTEAAYNIDFNDSDMNPNLFGRLSTFKAKRRGSASVDYDNQYATGIYNRGGNLLMEENPTTARLTLSLNHWQGRPTEYQRDSEMGDRESFAVNNPGSAL